MNLDTGDRGAEWRSLDIVQALGTAAEDDDLAGDLLGVEVRFQDLPGRYESLGDLSRVMQDQGTLRICRDLELPDFQCHQPGMFAESCLAAGT